MTFVHDITGQHKRIHSKAEVHALLFAQIDHLLRVRILQELELLAERVQNKQKGASEAPVIRRLTRGEWITLKTDGILPLDLSAMAIFVVPAVQKSLLQSSSAATDQSQTSNEAAEKPSLDSSSSSLPPRQVLPIASLRPLPDTRPQDSETSPAKSSLSASDLFLSPHLIPIYNGISLFPDAGQRVTLHARLQDILRCERHSRWSQGSSQSNSLEHNDKRGEGREKSSDAYLVRSDALTLLRADTVPLGIACWRLRMWEGEGWRPTSLTDDSDGMPELREGGWDLKSERGTGLLRRVRGRTIPKVARDG